ncbi:hypothetical protein Pmani_026079 [Petrolisthes manimaculis]|uniref:Uncharacterized protein n=2 Tax=Petrolisthes TaxID=84661 RepID=A0AAE1FGI7_PETCI|nr:hypothetical protein Pcinc_033769 [Petrolisthes cinctipes]KAK3873049.1 hypothetical protein Pcinc_021919 [Petrolisthes cinctipes]KAK4301812.1 hypothetical protein Pmani_026079 [Petrolisthes manimaculis]
MAMPEPIGLREIKYLPEEINIWMYAIVAIGSAFLVFVVISVYLMWRSMRAERSDIERETLCEAEKLPASTSVTSLHSDRSFVATP